MDYLLMATWQRVQPEATFLNVKIKNERSNIRFY